MLKYNNHKVEEFGQVNFFNDSTKRFSLSPAEQISAYTKAKSNYKSELDKFSDGQKLDKVTTRLFTKAYENLEMINTALRKEYETQRDAIDSQIETMEEGESKTWDNSYTDYNGQKVHDEIGVEIKNGNEQYFYIDESDPKHGPEKVYISESDFNQRLSDSLRNEIKNEQGIGEELYSLTAEDGSKFIIVDARDDTARANSFNDGFKDINMYYIAPDGTKTQMDKKDTEQLIKQNGVNIGDIEKGKTKELTWTEKMAKAAKVIDQVTERAKKFQKGMEDNMGLSTSTRA